MWAVREIHRRVAEQEVVSHGEAAIAASPVVPGVSRRKLLKLAPASGALIATIGCSGKKRQRPFSW